MNDYGRPVEFGWFMSPDADRPDVLLDAARVADRAGLDLIGVQDHPYNSGFLDTWTLLSAVGAVTERVRLFPDVANLPLRPPVMLAKAAASLDRITGGRVELGLGAGAFPDGIRAFGGTVGEPREKFEAVAEAIDVMDLFWSGRPASYAGKHFSMTGAHPGPRPLHDIGIWLGAFKPRMLDLLGRKADGWLPSLAFVPPDQLGGAHEQIDEAARSAGRDPAEITRIYNVWGDFSTGQWVDLLTQVTLDHGMNGYVFGVPPVESALRRISDEIAPAVREAVATERNRRST
ncbi:LLM class flavin-dependent oxidoreductase [Knoellia koreensis]|uniref:LLM class flavin-dependent oxidoreductase n=1 Tax=Knoellia koreensis TaxID=2730921 RepID=A0A849HJ65_9MICO|nr:LLM class flavin-dependent oxidoreductase [Knoellia sp. DB2414S]NNM47219.1 LLM class flavin-dependent oxidoreductase [Knoellia sp. DB2414S]